MTNMCLMIRNYYYCFDFVVFFYNNNFYYTPDGCSCLRLLGWLMLPDIPFYSFDWCLQLQHFSSVMIITSQVECLLPLVIITHHLFCSSPFFHSLFTTRTYYLLYIRTKTWRRREKRRRRRRRKERKAKRKKVKKGEKQLTKKQPQNRDETNKQTTTNKQKQTIQLS